MDPLFYQEHFRSPTVVSFCWRSPLDNSDIPISSRLSSASGFPLFSLSMRSHRLVRFINGSARVPTASKGDLGQSVVLSLFTRWKPENVNRNPSLGLIRECSTFSHSGILSGKIPQNKTRVSSVRYLSAQIYLPQLGTTAHLRPSSVVTRQLFLQITPRSVERIFCKDTSIAARRAAFYGSAGALPLFHSPFRSFSRRTCSCLSAKLLTFP